MYTWRKTSVIFDVQGSLSGELDVPNSYYDEVNVGGTRKVLEAAYNNGVKKIIYCSTCGVHGNVDNMVDAMMLAMHNGKGDGQAYLIADDSFIEIEKLVIKIAEALEVKVKTPQYPMWPLILAGHIFEKACKPFKISPPIFPRRVDWYRQNRAFKIDKTKRDLGYLPRVGIDEGLKRTTEWYKQEGYL